MSALIEMKEISPAAFMKYTDVTTAYNYMQSARARVVDGYFILYDIGSPWYSQEKFLIEDLIIRIYPTTKRVEVAIDALSRIAEHHGLKAVIAGDTQIGYMAPKYLAKGFVTLGTQLMKDIDYGLAPKGDGRASAD